MQAGDILAYKISKKTTNIFSKLISWISRVTVGNWLLDKDSFNHVAILSDIGGYQYELTWPRGGHNPINWNKYDVYSVQYQKLTDNQRKIIMDFCKNNCEKYKYDWLSLVTFGLFRLPGRVSVCSRFVADAYLAAGIELRKPNEHLISPNEIVYNSNMLLEIIFKTNK